jgi:hypothetical protein
MYNAILVHQTNIRLSHVLAVSLAFAFISIGSIGLVFAGYHSFKWVVFVCMPVGALFVMFCAALAMAGKIDNDFKK